MGAAPGTDIKLSEDRVRGFKHFANKLWNISRFVLENYSVEASSAQLLEEDKVSITEAKGIARNVTKYIEDFRLDLAADEVYHYAWDKFAATIIEISKPMLRDSDEATKLSKQRMLYENLLVILKLLHPFMPFVTEAIWQELPEKESDQLMVAKWPN